MSYIRGALGATVYGPELPPGYGVSNLQAESIRPWLPAGLTLEQLKSIYKQCVPAGTAPTQQSIASCYGFAPVVAKTAGCPSGYTKDIAGNCVKLPAESRFGKVASFFEGWFKQAQTAKGRAEGAAEALAQQQAALQPSATSYLPYLLIGGGVLAAVLLLRK
jgi:hypothetical protein